MSLQPVLCGSQRRSRCDRRQPQSRAALGEIRVIGEQRGPLDASVVWPCLRHPVTSWAPVDPFQLPLCCGWAVSLWGLEPHEPVREWSSHPGAAWAPASGSSAGAALLAPLTSDVRPLLCVGMGSRLAAVLGTC